MDEPCLCYCRGSASLLRSWQDMKVRKCTMCSYWKVPLLCIHAHIAYSITSSCVNRIGQGDSAVRLSTTVTTLYNWVVWAFMLLIQGGHTEQASLLYTVLSFTSISCQVLLTLARRPSVQITGSGLPNTFQTMQHEGYYLTQDYRLAADGVWTSNPLISRWPAWPPELQLTYLQ